MYNASLSHVSLREKHLPIQFTSGKRQLGNGERTIQEICQWMSAPQAQTSHLKDSMSSRSVTYPARGPSLPDNLLDLGKVRDLK